MTDTFDPSNNPESESGTPESGDEMQPFEAQFASDAPVATDDPVATDEAADAASIADCRWIIFSSRFADDAVVLPGAVVMLTFEPSA